MRHSRQRSRPKCSIRRTIVYLGAAMFLLLWQTRVTKRSIFERSFFSPPAKQESEPGLSNASSESQAISSEAEHEHTPQPPSHATTTKSRTELRDDIDRYCFLHLGPHKTGTTTIQKFALANSDVLLQDGYGADYVLGNRKVRQQFRLLEGCINENNKQCRTTQRWKQMMQDMTNTTVEKKHFFFSNEELAHGNLSADNQDWMDLVEQLTEHCSEVRFILVYRRYYEWIMSYYNQHYKYEGPFGVAMYQWPDEENGHRLPSFVEYWLSASIGDVEDRFFPNNQWNAELQRPQHTALALYHKLQALNHPKVSTTVISYHDDTPLLEQVICRALPSAPNACDAARASASLRTNVGRSYFDWDRIGLAAKDAGYVPAGVARNTARSIIGQLLEDVAQQLPRTCLDEATARSMYEVTREAEAVLAPSLLETLPAAWEASQSKLCGVDPVAVLENEEWRSRIVQALAAKG